MQTGAVVDLREVRCCVVPRLLVLGLAVAGLVGAGATHYFEGQPDVLDTALDALVGWVERV